MLQRPLSFSAFASVLLLGLGALSGCGNSLNNAVVKDCVLPQDQLGTLSGKWRTTPIPIAFHQGDFTSAEISAMTQAASTWNDFYSQSLGMAPVDFGDPSNPRTSNVSRPQSSFICSSSITQGSAYSGQIVIYKNTAWPFPDQPGVIALTSYCRVAASPLPYFYMQIIDLNYQNFFSSGRKNPDLQTIILHEFGHMLGLNHTCNATASNGVPGCSDPSLNPAYISALMYPTFGFDASNQGEQKRTLTDNDMGRANCLYKNFGN